MLVEALTDNRNRAVAEIRSAFTRAGGSLGESGCVAWLFEPRGVIAVEREATRTRTSGAAALSTPARRTFGRRRVPSRCSPNRRI